MKKKPPRAKRLLASCLLTVRFKSQSERPLSDNGKPVVRPGRKATGQENLIAGLPKRGATRSRRWGSRRQEGSHDQHLASRVDACAQFPTENSPRRFMFVDAADWLHRRILTSSRE